MDSGDLIDIPAYFTTDGLDIWELKTYCLQPTCVLENLKTGRKESFGMGGITAQNFMKIKMPVER